MLRQDDPGHALAGAPTDASAAERTAKLDAQLKELVRCGLEFAAEVPGRSDMTVPLASDPNASVHDEASALLYMHRLLYHQLVLTKEQQASAFREGVLNVTGHPNPQRSPDVFSAFTPAELNELWSSQRITNERLESWRQRTMVQAGAETSATFFWECLQEFDLKTRARVLKYGTGSAALPTAILQPLWLFHIYPSADPPTITKTQDNGTSLEVPLIAAATCAHRIYLPYYVTSEIQAQLHDQAQLHELTKSRVKRTILESLTWGENSYGNA